MKSLLAACAIAVAGMIQTPAAAQVPNKPNVVIVLCDDLGIGDVHAFNPDRGKIPTPIIDRLASQGMMFTDAHASSALCSPSRYSILTGRYNWRSRLQSGVLGGDAEPLITPGRETVASFLKQQGYTSTIMGKWHLGLTFGNPRFTSPLTDGPLQHGFDHFFGIAASLDMSPFAWIEDDHFPETPAAAKKGARSVQTAPHFEAIDVLPTLTTKAVDYIKTHGSAGAKPYFLYLAFTAPHTPLVPTAKWKGKSGLGDYGDFVMQVDASLGDVVNAIDASGERDNTIVYLTSDNGCAPYVGVKELEAKGHFPSAVYRGYKSDIWEGGHRIPLVVRWPGVVAAGSKSGQLVGLIDLFRTTADILHQTLPDNAAEDSFSLLPILQGKDAPVRPWEIQHSGDGYFAIREGNWKVELCGGSGGWGHPTENQAATRQLPKIQLYDLATDIGEKKNVEADHPDISKRLTQLLVAAINDGRTTPGQPQKNDSTIDIYKKPVAKTEHAKENTAPGEGND